MVDVARRFTATTYDGALLLQAAPPLVELLAAYELRVAELASSRNPPRSPGPGTSSAGPPVGAD